MKLVARIFNSRFPDDFPNGVYEATEYNSTDKLAWVYCNGKYTSFDCDSTHETCEASIHISTGRRGKNGREILVGDDVSNEHGSEYRVVTDGTLFYLWSMDTILLTPKLAATLEVVE